MNIIFSLEKDKIAFMKSKNLNGLIVIRSILNSIHYLEIKTHKIITELDVREIIKIEYRELRTLKILLNKKTHKKLYKEIKQQMNAIENYIDVEKKPLVKIKVNQNVTNLQFDSLLNEVRKINKLEPKSLAIKLVKFNEEFGEFSAEIIKALGESPKPYSKIELTNEMADVLQVILSIYDTIDKKYGITIDDVFAAMKTKNEKWKSTINKYQKNQ